MNLTHCPYDGTDVETDYHTGSYVVLSCWRCGAAWEIEDQVVHRIQEPDREVVHAAHSIVLDAHESATQPLNGEAPAAS